MGIIHKLLFISIAFNLLLGIASYTVIGKNAVLKEEVYSVKNMNLSLEVSLNRQKEMCSIADRISSELQEQSIQAKKKEQNLLNKIDRLGSNEQKTYVDSHGALSPDLTRLLREAYNSDSNSP